MNRSVSLPSHGETSPVDASDAFGMAFVAGVADAFRRERGLYLTPAPIARFMASTLSPRKGRVRLLDPAAGVGILACAAVERLVVSGSESIELVAYEIDEDTCDALRATLGGLVAWAADRGVRLDVDVRRRDFVLAEAAALKGRVGDGYDVAIANPPYFKVGKGDPRAVAASELVHGQPNIYGLFMGVVAALLRPGGETCMIVPRSFASGLYFRALRERLFGMVRPTRLHSFVSRESAFGRDDVLQENVIVTAVRDDGWDGGDALVGSSAGIHDLASSRPAAHALDGLVDRHGGWNLSFPGPRTAACVGEWPDRLASLGLHVATGPVVTFRAKERLRSETSPGTVPLLWMNHVEPMRISWPASGRKPEHLVAAGPGNLVKPAGNYVVVRRFSPKEQARRIVAAPLVARDLASTGYAFENHLNYVARIGGTLSDEEAVGLAAVLNSSRLDAWFRARGGNTQVSATEMRAMPLPAWEAIRAVGRAAPRSLDDIDGLVDAL